jgi:3-dehydroquinate dehydratase-2
MSIRLAVVHGPNLNLLGQREPSVYGRMTLAELNTWLLGHADALGVVLEVVQSNHEGVLVDWIQQTGPGVDGFVVNAAGLTHTSVVLRDALLATSRPFVEVHLSNVWARESFRHVSLLADRAVGVASGLGRWSYLAGLQALADRVRGDAGG